MRTDYAVEITETSKELSMKERVMIKDTSDCIRLDKATAENGIIIDVDYWAELSIHNEKSTDKDYANYVLVDKNGDKYVTGSASFWNSFMDIWNEAKDFNDEWSLKVYQKESKNRAGKYFITCSVI